MAVVLFHLNGKEFEVDEGSPTWERLVGEGHKPSGAVVVDVEPVKAARGKSTDPAGKPPTKSQLVKRAKALDVDVTGLDADAIAAAIAAAETAVGSSSVPDPDDPDADPE